MLPARAVKRQVDDYVKGRKRQTTPSQAAQHYLEFGELYYEAGAYAKAETYLSDFLKEVPFRDDKTRAKVHILLGKAALALAGFPRDEPGSGGSAGAAGGGEAEMPLPVILPRSEMVRKVDDAASFFDCALKASRGGCCF